MPRKKKKAVTKRRVQTAAKKKRKSKPEKNAPVSHRVKFTERPSMSDIEAPEGFRAISASQAAMEFAQPVIDQIKNPDINELNELLKIGMGIWNYEISERKPEIPPIESKNDIIERIEKILGFDGGKANEFFEMMLERKEYLFPAAIQPENPTIDFIRKEPGVQVKEFDYSKLDFTEKPVPPDEKDHEMINAILQMDKYLLTHTPYDDWEPHFFDMKEKCETRYQKWLIDKGLRDYSGVFSDCISVYLDFIYLYMHDDITLLSRIEMIYFKEFFFDFILRKWSAGPDEYTACLPGLKMFYNFLFEKGYLNDPKPFIWKIDRIGPQFIKILKKRYES